MAAIFEFYLKIQADIQAAINPAGWLFFAFKHHSEQVEWTITDSTLEEVKTNLEKACNDLDNYCYFKTFGNNDKNNNAIVLMYFITPGAKWLDKIDIKLTASNSSTTIKAEVLCASTGFLPISIPLAFLWNCFLFWFPFLDFKMTRKEHQQLEKYLSEKAKMKISSRMIRHSFKFPPKQEESSTKQD